MSHNEACYCLRNGATKFCDNCPTHRGGAAPPRPDEAAAGERDYGCSVCDDQAGPGTAKCPRCGEGGTVQEQTLRDEVERLRAASAASEQRARAEALEEVSFLLETEQTKWDAVGRPEAASAFAVAADLVRALSGRPTQAETGGQREQD